MVKSGCRGSEDGRVRWTRSLYIYCPHALPAITGRGGIKRITKLGVFRACAGHHLEPVKGTGPLVPSNLAFRKSKTSATATATPGSPPEVEVAPYTALVAPSASRYAVRCH